MKNIQKFRYQACAKIVDQVFLYDPVLCGKNPAHPRMKNTNFPTDRVSCVIMLDRKSVIAKKLATLHGKKFVKFLSEAREVITQLYLTRIPSNMIHYYFIGDGEACSEYAQNDYFYLTSKGDERMEFIHQWIVEAGMKCGLGFTKKRK